jgi:hypothetical protein
MEGGVTIFPKMAVLQQVNTIALAVNAAYGT